MAVAVVATVSAAVSTISTTVAAVSTTVSAILGTSGRDTSVAVRGRRTGDGRTRRVVEREGGATISDNIVQPHCTKGVAHARQRDLHECGRARLEDELAPNALRELVVNTGVLALLAGRVGVQALEPVAR